MIVRAVCYGFAMIAELIYGPAGLKVMKEELIMSKKYIECEAAKEQIRAHIIIGEPKTNVGLNLAVEAIDEVPVADVVERPRWIPVE
jgi:hypothetical protein